MNHRAIYTASEARKKLYNLIRSAAAGMKSYEINLRGSDPVVLVNKAELEAWQETLDILANPEEIKNLRLARKSKKIISHKDLLKDLKLSHAT